jgi:DNA-binding response OmpR family regulator
MASEEVKAASYWTASTRPAALRVLVVEPVAAKAITMARWLCCHGHEVDLARTGARGCQAICQRQPDVVLLDLNAPGVNGWAGISQMRALAAAKPFFLIALGTADQSFSVWSGEEAGIDLFLTGPVDLELLRRLLGRIQSILC